MLVGEGSPSQFLLSQPASHGNNAAAVPGMTTHVTFIFAADLEVHFQGDKAANRSRAYSEFRTQNCRSFDTLEGLCVAGMVACVMVRVCE